MNAAVIAAVRVPPSALSTSASIWIVQGPSALRSTTARRLRPISRWISVARPSGPRLIRDEVLPGSMAYSAVSQPIDFPSRNGGTRVRQARRHQDRGLAAAVQHAAGTVTHESPLDGDGPKLVVGAVKRSGHGQSRSLRVSRRRPAALCRLLIAEEPDQERHLKMKPVGRLGNDLAARAVEHVGGHLFAAMGGKAVEEDRIGLGAAPSGLD